MSQKKQAEELFMGGETIASIAAKLDVNRRTIERWANDGAWREKRGNVVSIGDTKKPKPKSAPAPTVNRSQPARDPMPRRSRGSGEIDELEVVTIAISDISALLGSEIDPRNIGSCATALCRLIELRLKLKPRTATELAEQAIALGMSPAEFARELRAAWEKRA